MITRDDILAAAERISPHVRRTPVLDYKGEVACELKLEQLQKTGSFKARGAFNTLLSRDVPAAGVAAASGGNHGAAVAFAAHALGHPANIFVPDIVSPAKRAAIEAAGATIHVGGARYAEALNACEAFRDETGAMGVHAFDAPATIAGQGTVAAEWAADTEGLDTVLVAVGGGGLIGGIAAWFGGETAVVGVEPRVSRCLHDALEAGAPLDVSVAGVAADSLGAKRVGDLNFEIAKGHVERVVLVDDEDIRRAQQVLWRDVRAVTEPGGAAAFAALLGGAYVPAAGERVGVLVCGANVTPAAFAELF